MAEYPTRFKSSANMLVPLYQVTWHHVADICTLFFLDCTNVYLNQGSNITFFFSENEM